MTWWKCQSLLQLFSLSFFLLNLRCSCDPICEFYESTNIGFFFHSWNCSGGFPRSPVCFNATLSTWDGIHCHNGMVTEIGFPNLLDLTGTLPSSLGTLTSLQYLVLNNNGLSGTIPDSLGFLTALIGLYLSSNSFKGIIPSTLSTMSSLKYLNLDNNLFTNTIPDSVGDISTLVILDVVNNLLTGSIPETLCSDLAIQQLDVSGNDISCYPSCITTVSYRDFPSKSFPLGPCTPSGQPTGQPTGQPSNQPSTLPHSLPYNRLPYPLTRLPIHLLQLLLTFRRPNLLALQPTSPSRSPTGQPTGQPSSRP